MSFRCPAIRCFTTDTKGFGGVCVCVCECETLKWDHRHNWTTALDTYPPLITSPIRKHLHWQNHRQGLINSCLIREASLHFPQPTDSTCSMNTSQSRDRRIPWTKQDGLKLMSITRWYRFAEQRKMQHINIYSRIQLSKNTLTAD